MINQREKCAHGCGNSWSIDREWVAFYLREFDPKNLTLTKRNTASLSEFQCGDKER